MKNFFSLSGTLIAMALLLSSCGDEICIPEVLGAYLQTQQEPKTVSAEYDAYFDLSDGMLSAYSETATDNALKSVVNKVTGNAKCKNVFTLKNNAIEASELRQTDLYNYITNPDSYEMIAPIEEALNQIVSKGQAAFLLTDFEEYSGGMIQQQNYAKKYFIDWLKAGNRIVFYIVDYNEKGKNKHLYFTVFDTVDHILLTEISDALKGTGLSYKQFNLNNDEIYCGYKDANHPVTIGGTYHDNLGGEDLVSCTNETGEKDCYTIYPEHRAEFYPFEASWTDIVANAKATSEEGNDPVFTHLLSGIMADFRQMTGYDVKQLGVRVTDIQQDYDKFAGYYAYLKDNTVNVGEDGKILPEYDYTKGPGPIGEVQDMFVFNGNVKDGVCELILDFRPHFSGVIANMPMDDLLRIDVVITSVEPNYDILSDLFEWEGNRSLVESVKNTLQDRLPAGRTVFSFFVKALN